jgi:DNA-binding transcriptional LysR family regulator
MESWLGVELRHLMALAAVHEERSFRGAAERLGYVQSVVSQRIAQLERTVGVRLVERARGHSRVELTPAGETLMHHAEQVLSQLSAAHADLRSLERRDGLSLRVGACQSLATGLLPRALGLLEKRAPDVHVEIREALSDGELFPAVECGDLDVAFAELPLEPGTFESIELLVDPLMLLVPADSALATRRETPQLAEMAEHPMVVDPSWRMMGLVEAEFAAAGLTLEKRFRVSTNRALQALVGAGLAIAIVPRLSVNLDDPTTTAIDLTDTLPSRTLACYWHRDRRENAAISSLLEAIRGACAELTTQVPPPATPGAVTPLPLDGVRLVRSAAWRHASTR